MVMDKYDLLSDKASCFMNPNQINTNLEKAIELSKDFSYNS